MLVRQPQSGRYTYEYALSPAASGIELGYIKTNAFAERWLSHQGPLD